MKKRIFTKIFNDKNLPFVELRYSNNTKHYKNHIHNTFSIGMNLKGKTIYSNKTKKYEFDVGMLAIVNPKEVHSCNPVTKEPNLYYMLYLDPNWCYGIQKSIFKDLEGFKPFEEDVLYDEEIYTDFKNLCNLLFSEISYKEKEQKLIQFFTKLFKLYMKESEQKKENKDFEKIADYLEQNSTENISLEELSKEFNLNPFYIIRIFKAQKNITPHAYLLNMKINRAKKLLKEQKSITFTALECGFSDQSHFHRNFCKYVAATPKEYKLNFVQD
ncbi:AraC family transcriptional regulator [Halarcobacter anaerophilus]|uniref:AraC family transcriptional regulator n=1 Tax=Halarcobacter anaerophilus TaxID=877500 RepID=A0A4Q0Y2H9_9BACT|nr:AraC family transcriptional regulator [Halarcobacter anaerophilus]QDF27526.1 transcriptional regulator, AraC family [Halarcobacter anaerophilus]RXJ63883.1 AraC family transcriptional regulator [Halarcobacter anaerophilus]